MNCHFLLNRDQSHSIWKRGNSVRLIMKKCTIMINIEIWRRRYLCHTPRYRSRISCQRSLQTRQPSISRRWRLCGHCGHAHDQRSSLSQRSIAKKKNDRGWECEAINHLRASGGLPPKSEASALTQCIILSLSLFLDFDGTLSNSDLGYTVTTRSALLSGESRRLPKDVALFLKF